MIPVLIQTAMFGATNVDVLGIGGVRCGGDGPTSRTIAALGSGGVALGGDGDALVAGLVTRLGIGGVRCGGDGAAAASGGSAERLGIGGVRLGGVGPYAADGGESPADPVVVDAGGGLAFGGVAIVGGTAATPGPATEWDLYTAIADALESTREFDEVYRAGTFGPAGKPANDLLTVAIEPGQVDVDQLGDGAGDGSLIYTTRVTLRIRVRMDDDEAREKAVGRLRAILGRRLNGRKLIADDLPDFNRLAGWRNMPTDRPERLILAEFQARWEVAGWDVAALSDY